VVDGDTVEVEIGGSVERVRLIGIDTPETVHPNKPVQCYGREASDRAKAALSGQDVLLEDDPSQDSRDRYGRLLRYVWLPDGHLFNLDMVADGYAYEYTYRDPYRYRDAFIAAQATARDEGRGLWSAITCAGQAVPAEVAPTQPPTIEPAPTSPPAPASTEPAPPPASGQSTAPLPPSFADCAMDPNAGAAPNAPVKITVIDKGAETVTLQNVGPGPVSLSGWVMCSVKGKQRHDIGGTLAPGETRTFEHSGKNIWNNSASDPGLLYDPQGHLISSWPD
jgi:micrococcal nuclease